jgi:hybrid cluster-associated redox disulfide protein
MHLINNFRKMTKKEKKFVLNKDSNIMETVQNYPGAVEVFAKHGLPCVGCAAAHFERISDIAGEFGVDADKLIDEIKKAEK